MDPRTAASALDIPFGKLLAYGAGGVGMAALENKYVGNNLPPELKNVNLGVGGATGVMLASRNPAMQIAGLGTIPIKQMGMFAIGGMDRFRRQQQALTDTNLATAKVNETTALQQKDNAGSQRLMELAFLIPALAGGGALAYNAFDQWKKRHAKQNRLETIGSAGARRPSQRVRIDLPPSALPSSFYQALANSETSPSGYARLQTKGASAKAASGWSQNLQDAHPTLQLFQQNRPQSRVGQALGLLKDIAWQTSGIPAIGNAARDAGKTFSSLNDGDYSNASRYGMSGAGNAALGVLALRFGGLGMLGKILGRARLGGVARSGALAKDMPAMRRLFDAGEIKRQMGTAPTMARSINKWGFGDELGPTYLSKEAPVQSHIDKTIPPATGAFTGSERGYVPGTERMSQRGDIAAEKGFGSSFTRNPMRRALDMEGRYDPKRYAWQNPTTSSALFRGALSAGNRPMGRSLITQGLEVPKYLANRAVNAGYWGKQFVKRHPVATGWTALPVVGGTGVVADDLQKQHDEEQPRPWMPNVAAEGQPSSTTFMPPSAVAGGLLGSFGGQGGLMSPLQSQFVRN